MLRSVFTRDWHSRRESIVPEDRIEDIIARRVVELLEQRAAIAPQRLMSLRQAAKYLGLTEEALRSKAAIGRIPVVLIDSNRRFDVQDLDRLIDKNKRGAQS